MNYYTDYRLTCDLKGGRHPEVAARPGLRPDMVATSMKKANACCEVDVVRNQSRLT